MPVSEDEFRSALSCFASGVSIVTTIDAAGNLHGLTVSAFCSVSLSPPLVLICIEKITASHFAFQESNAFVVNILDEEQASLSEHFATPFDDKFGVVDFRPGIGGIPVITNTLASLECRVRNAFDGGDHSIFVGEVENITVKNGKPLVYFRSEYRMIDM
jgi:flavin reductase (DIM6/NTAB) family NADH-FMN oxidoreductase RutF